MNDAPDLLPLFDPPDEILQAGKDGELVFFVGAGASILLGLPSWLDLAKKALTELRVKGFINYSELEQLEKLDPKKQLTIAFLIAKEKGYKLDITQYLKGFTEGDSVYKAINDIAPPCVTTNYDELLAPRFLEVKDGTTTPTSIIRISNREEFFASRIDDPGTVVHLHGSVSKPETMVVTTGEYLLHYEHENVKHFLGELFDRKTVLFIGYGLEEAEILEHILRRGSAKKTVQRKRFSLQPFFSSEETVYKHLHSYYKDTFGVHLLGYNRDHEDYKQLEFLMKSWVSQIEIKRPPLGAVVDYMNKVLDHE